MSDIIVVFTDASFDSLSKTAIIGYMVNKAIVTKIITTNTEAELGVILWVMAILNVSLKYILYTYCKTAVDVLHKSRFNGAIYTNFLEKLQPHPDLKLGHLQGHKRLTERTDLDREFAILHKQLRAMR